MFQCSSGDRVQWRNTTQEIKYKISFQNFAIVFGDLLFWQSATEAVVLFYNTSTSYKHNYNVVMFIRLAQFDPESDN